MRVSSELRERTKRFGSRVIRIYINLRKAREEVRVIGRQLLRSGISVAAHVREASRARSDTEFCSKLDAMLQEADESQLWLEYLSEDCQLNSSAVSEAHQEAEEIIAIFTTIVAKVRRSR